MYGRNCLPCTPRDQRNILVRHRPVILNTVHNENHSKTIFGQVVVKILSLNDLWEGVVAGPAQPRLRARSRCMLAEYTGLTTTRRSRPSDASTRIRKKRKLMQAWFPLLSYSLQTLRACRLFVIIPGAFLVITHTL